jgi:hypothetical protein
MRIDDDEETQDKDDTMGRNILQQISEDATGGPEC